MENEKKLKPHESMRKKMDIPEPICHQMGNKPISQISKFLIVVVHAFSIKNI
mgnify:CR=1 FL=1